MPATNYAVLYDFETLMENGIVSAIAAMLTTAGITTIQVNPTRDTDTEMTPRVEVLFSPGSSNGHYTATGQPNPKQVPDQFEGTAIVRIVTTRPIPTNNASLHGTIRGWVRYTMTAGARGFNETILPYLQILDMLPTSGEAQVYDEKSQDITELTYKVTFGIRQSAWPLN